MIVNEKLKKEVTELGRKYSLALLVLFGSQARGDSRKRSDFDIAYSSIKPLELGEENRMAVELHSIFKTTGVDLVNIGKAYPLLLKKIVEEGVVLYEAKESLFNNLYLYGMKLYRESLPLNELRRRYVLRRTDQFKKELGHAR